MQGLGNDFLIFDCTKDPFELNPETIRKLSDRHFGIGCDQILVIEPSASIEHALHYRIFNADGGEVAQCGNGARCIARYAYDHQLVKQPHFKISTTHGEMSLQLEANNQVTVNIGAPVFEPRQIPLSSAYQQSEFELAVKAETIKLHTVSLGNPHAVLFVDNVTTAPVDELGSLISTHAAFPDDCNVSFAEVVDLNTIKLRVYERGTAETLACGSGACATMVVAHHSQRVANSVKLNLTGGELYVRWEGGPTDPVLMTGPAEYVFKGQLLLNEES